MDSLSSLLKSKSSSMFKYRTPLLKSIGKKLPTPTSRRELFQNIYLPMTTKSRRSAKSQDKNTSNISLLKLQSTPTKEPRSKSFHKSSASQSLRLHTKIHADPSAKKLISPKKPFKLLKFSPKAPQNSKKKLILQLKKVQNEHEDLSEHIESLSFRTKTGVIRGKTKPNNQDDFFVIHDYGQKKNQTLFGIMDGHGMYGHEVSSYVKKQLPVNIEAFLSQLPSPSNTCLSISEPTDGLEQCFIKSFKCIQSSLIAKKTIDINYSGTTAITILLRDKLCLCANLGDSRAIIGRYNEAWYPFELSHDHKPSNTYEKMRIEMAGGRVEPFKEEHGNFVGPDRVWLKHEQLPGLAMSRSFGDLVAAHVGVISEPEVKIHEITEADKFIVIASDGIWEFINSQECVRIVSEYYERNDIEKACDVLMKTAVELWTREDDVIDDITFVILFFKN